MCNFQAKLADFGAVRSKDGAETRVVGTPGFVDPAYIRSGIADSTADIYR